MIAILMNLRGLDLQSAVDFVGDLCKQTIDAFVENQRSLPSFGPELDRDVAMYVQGLQDWLVGSLHWSFMTKRYFGDAGADVKQHRIVKLLPRRGDRAQVHAQVQVSARRTTAGVLRTTRCSPRRPSFRCPNSQQQPHTGTLSRLPLGRRHRERSLSTRCSLTSRSWRSS